jgi:hypothetical protein
MKRILSDGTTQEQQVGKLNIENKSDHWVNEAVKIIDSVDCHVPRKISNVMKSFNFHFPSSEFSIFCIIEYDKENKCFKLRDEYFVPKQRVSHGGVDYNEDAPDGYNCVVHKHPRGCRNFSGTDDTYINQNFDYSLLWEGGEFILGQVRLNTELGRISIKLNVKEESETYITIPKEQLDKIQETVVVMGCGSGYGKNGYNGIYGHGWNNGWSNGWSNEKDFNKTFNQKSGYPIGKKLSKRDKIKQRLQMRRAIKHQFDQGDLLSDEQTEVGNFLNEQKEQLMEYLDDINVIAAERGVSKEEAERIYLEENKEKLGESLLNFEDKDTLGTGMKVSEINGIEGV